MKWWGRRAAAREEPFDATVLVAIDRALAADDLAGAAAQLAALPASAFGTAAAHDLAARLHAARGEYPAAEARYETALALDDRDLFALCGLAELRARARHTPDAIALYRRAVDVSGGAPALKLKLAAMLADAGAEPEALALADSASDEPQSNVVRAMILERMDRLEEAEGIYTSAALGDSHGAWAGRGRIARLLGDFPSAERAFREAERRHPGGDYALDVGTALLHQRRYAEAIEVLEIALAKRPDWADAALNLANALIASGNLTAGWQRYEARFDIPGTQWGAPAAAAWDGSAFRGETLVVDAEQGFGDSILAARFVRMARARGGRVVLRCPPQLLALMQASGVADEVLPAGTTLAADWHCHMLSLPRALRVARLDDLRVGRYLAAPGDARARARDLIRGGSFRIGIVWSGRANAPQNRYRAIDPKALAAALDRDSRVRIYSLQVPEGAIATCPPGVVDLSAALRDFGATAGVLESLDLVISIESAVAHLAGALGVRAWVPYPKTADWRWIIGERDSPWYDSVKLFHPSRPMDWSDVIDAMASELATLLD